MIVLTADADALNTFRTNWPDHRLDGVHHIHYSFTEDGVLTDFDAFDVSGTSMRLTPSAEVTDALIFLAEIVWQQHKTRLRGFDLNPPVSSISQRR